MKTITLAIFLIALATAQAGIVDYVLNRTSLTGKATFNTTNGLNLGYNGSLTYNLGGKTIPILGLGVSFDAAAPQISSANGTNNASVRYNGAINIINSGGVASNVTVSGVAALASSVGMKMDNKTKGANITFNTVLSDTNSFAVRTGTTVVTARSTTGLTASGDINANGNHLKVNEDVSFAANIRGSVSSNGTSLGAFTATKDSEAHVKNCIHLNPNATGKKPYATFRGGVKANDVKTFAFQGTTYNVSKQGGAVAGGHWWIKNGSVIAGMGIDEAFGYGYTEDVSVNGTVVAKNKARGVGGFYHAHEVNTTSTGASIDHQSAGKIRHFQKTWIPGNQTNKTQKVGRKPSKFVEMIDESDIAMTEESSVEFIAGKPMNNRNSSLGCHHHHRHHHHCHHHHHHRHNHSCHHKGIRSFLEAGWKAGTHATVTLTDATNNVVNATSAAVYGARGWDSKTRKPWNFRGNNTINASFKNTVTSNSINDITVQLVDNPALVNKVAKMADPKMMPDPKFPEPKTHPKTQPKKQLRKQPQKQQPRPQPKTQPKTQPKGQPKKL